MGAAAASPQAPTRPRPPPPSLRAKRMRRHGCQTPWAPAQIVALGVVLLSIVVFYVFTVHELPSDLRRTVLVLVSAQVAMVALLYVAISILDPAHPAVIERQRRQRQPSNTSATRSCDDSVDLESHSGGSGAPVGSPALSSSSSSSAASSSSATTATPARSHLQCALCDASVSTGTRHCSVCRKCVVGFDHHCVYINTCIGARNYPLFIALLTCSILLVATQLVIACFAIDRLQRRGATTRALVIGALCVLPLLQLLCMVFLATFHSYLFCKGLRTYEWLQRFNQKTAQRYAAKTPKWSHQSERRTVRYLHDDDEEDDTGNDRFSNRDNVARHEHKRPDHTIEVASHV